MWTRGKTNASMKKHFKLSRKESTYSAGNSPPLASSDLYKCKLSSTHETSSPPSPMIIDQINQYKIDNNLN